MIEDRDGVALSRGGHVARRGGRGKPAVGLRPSHGGQSRFIIVAHGTDGSGTAHLTCYMAVTQTLTMLQMKLMTPESSVFIADHIRPSPSGEGYQVIGVYTNEPSIHLRDARISEMHQGALLLETHGSSHRPDALTGKYWTNRKTVGSMALGSRVKERYSRFDDANRAFSATASGGVHGAPCRLGRESRAGRDAGSTPLQTDIY